jgi:hypothetical protein
MNNPYLKPIAPETAEFAKTDEVRMAEKIA